ncbi:MAG: 4-(cytidine 5'-diphospho)-2-C-methyl-D-erythritol kinase [Akkermansiaceae bacterium]|nr:4-(cytidine 5'-diphospho)-2-C-methyl-D-erythritol kinase [Akkermansiaceae bacterium]
MIIDAPAKLNLSLRILGKRADGFHELESVMVRLPGLADRLEIEVADEDHFTCNQPGVPLDGSNLVLKAVAAIREVTGNRVPLRIHLEKRVPHGAGLGGGSSDAASTLLALDQMLGSGLGMDGLMELGGKLGSDIPFFMGPAVARVRGRGEIIESGPTLPSLPVLLFKPGFGVATPDAYRRWADSEEIPGVGYAAQAFSWGELLNDLERPVFSKHRFLAELKEWLRAQPGVAGALMSGSGSTVFAVLEDAGAAAEIVAGAHRALDPTLWAWSGWTAAGEGS